MRLARRTLILWAVAAMVAGLWPSAAAAPSLPGIPNPKTEVDAPEIGRYGGTLVTAQIGEPRTFNPVVMTDNASGSIVGPLFEGLVEANYLTGEIEPALAEAWTVSRDGRTWTFTLRAGVQWSDGRPLTMDDVVFSLQAVFTKGVQSMTVDLLTFGGRPVKWRRLDGRRIEFLTDQPQGFFLRLIQGLVVIPRHKLQAALARGSAAFNTTWGVNTAARELVGTGPFVMRSYAFGARVTYARNPAYWRVDKSGQRLPYLERLVVQIVPNLDAEKLKFLARETDLYGARNREFAELKIGEARGNYTVYDGPETFSSEYLVFNQNPRGLTGPRLAWFTDVAFRRALNHAIDRDSIVRQVYAGRATPAWSPVSIALKRYHNPSVRTYTYDLARAQSLLAEAGYKKGDGGTLRDGKGNPVAFTIATNVENADRVAIANIVRQDFTKLGIQVTLSPEAFGTLVTKLDNTFKWDVIILGLGGDNEPGTARSYWLSSGNLHDWNPRQTSPATPWEAEIDRLFEQAARETNADKRRTLYGRWQEIVADQVPALYFTNPKTQPAVRNTLGNTRLGLQGATGRLEWRYYRTPR